MRQGEKECTDKAELRWAQAVDFAGLGVGADTGRCPLAGRDVRMRTGLSDALGASACGLRAGRRQRGSGFAALFPARLKSCPSESSGCGFAALFPARFASRVRAEALTYRVVPFFQGSGCGFASPFFRHSLRS